MVPETVIGTFAVLIPNYVEVTTRLLNAKKTAK
jgi:hypothetical protein